MCAVAPLGARGRRRGDAMPGAGASQAGAGTTRV
jgi:hypothetical protein